MKGGESGFLFLPYVKYRKLHESPTFSPCHGLKYVY
jgi:hypothetical protein